MRDGSNPTSPPPPLPRDLLMSLLYFFSATVLNRVKAMWSQKRYTTIFYLLIFTNISHFPVFPLRQLLIYFLHVQSLLYSLIVAVHSRVSSNVEMRKMASLPSTFWRIWLMNIKTSVLKKFYLMLVVVRPFFCFV